MTEDDRFNIACITFLLWSGCMTLGYAVVGWRGVCLAGTVYLVGGLASEWEVLKKKEGEE